MANRYSRRSRLRMKIRPNNMRGRKQAMKRHPATRILYRESLSDVHRGLMPRSWLDGIFRDRFANPARHRDKPADRVPDVESGRVAADAGRAVGAKPVARSRSRGAGNSRKSG